MAVPVMTTANAIATVRMMFTGTVPMAGTAKGTDPATAPISEAEAEAAVAVVTRTATVTATARLLPSPSICERSSRRS